jgi:hypothetical protein
MEKEGYIYLGQYYDVLGRPLILSDKKIGLSKDPVLREYQLNRTKSPIGYTIIWRRNAARAYCSCTRARTRVNDFGRTNIST